MVLCGGEIPNTICTARHKLKFGITTFEKQMLDGFWFTTKATSFASFPISPN